MSSERHKRITPGRRTAIDYELAALGIGADPRTRGISTMPGCQTQEPAFPRRSLRSFERGDHARARVQRTRRMAKAAWTRVRTACRIPTAGADFAERARPSKDDDPGCCPVRGVDRDSPSDHGSRRDRSFETTPTEFRAGNRAVCFLNRRPATPATWRGDDFHGEPTAPAVSSKKLSLPARPPPT